MPELDLRQFGKTTTARKSVGSPRLSGGIVCGVRRGTPYPVGNETHTSAHREARVSGLAPSEPDGSLKNKRVAFVALTEGPGVQEVTLVGTTATLKLEDLGDKHPTPTAAFIQVVGGDYAASESSAFATNESVVVKLQPRCSHFVAEVPSHVARIRSISLDSPSLRAIAGRTRNRIGAARHPADAPSFTASQLRAPGRVPEGVTCTPEDPVSRMISLELPFTPADEEKRLSVTYATEQVTQSEARWTESLPPKPLKLAVRSIQFHWHRPVGCLAERWSEATPKPQPGEQRTWSQSCPRVTLSNSTVCGVTSREPMDDSTVLKTCDYHCAIDREMDTLPLPIPLVFDRIRTNPDTHQPEVIYSWRDQLEYSGQGLTSTVAPDDRRVMVEFRNPSDWRDRYGDKIDSIRVLSGQSSNQFDLMGRDPAEVAPPWVSLPTPGRTCSDRVRVAVIGTRRYDETTLEVRDGRVELTRPYDYRPHLLFYGLVGTGALFRHLTSNVRSATFGDLGLGGQYDLGGPWSFDAELTGQLTHTFYEGIELSQQQRSDFLAVPYLRFDVRGALEWWHHRRFGAALSVGIGLGTPLGFADARIVGAVRMSALIEAQPLIFTMFPGRLWFLAGTGFRLLEQHMDYVTDFAGSPTPNLERDPQWYVFLRFRGALE